MPRSRRLIRIARLRLPVRTPDYVARIALLEAADRHWSPPPLESLHQTAQRPLATWLESLGWLEWRTLEIPESREFARRMQYGCSEWPTWQQLTGQKPVHVFVKGWPPPSQDVTCAARQALEAWGRMLPLVQVPEWVFDMAIASCLDYEFTGQRRWVIDVGRRFECLPNILGWQPRETEKQFIRRARREFEQGLRDYIRAFRFAHGLGLRRSDTRRETVVRHAEWTARFLAGTAAYRMSEDFDEDAVLRAVHRFCDRIGLDLATMRRPPEPFGRAQGRTQNAVLRQRLRSLCADAGSQSNLS
jgi:hypothetical protein